MKNRFLSVTSAIAVLVSALAQPVAVTATVVPTGSANVLPAAVTEPVRAIGFYVPGSPLDTAPLAQLEGDVGRRATFSTYFQNCEEQGFTAEQAGNAVGHGAVPLITLEMWNPAKGVAQSAYSLKAIAAGRHDAYLRQFAADARDFEDTVWLRIFHEMNGNWYPWCGTVNGNTPAEFVSAWRHVKSVFDQAGADNVKFVWCANIDSIDASGRVNTSANAISRDWPGDAYVDYITLDGYNFGTGDGMEWRSFASLFERAYDEVTALSADPVIVAETGCATVGGDKAAWIAETFRVIPARFPRIVALGWFNQKKDRDWRIDSSTGSLQSFAAGVAGAGWAGAQPTTASLVKSATSSGEAVSTSVLRYGSTLTLTARLATEEGPVAGRLVVFERSRDAKASSWAPIAARTTGSGGTTSLSFRPSGTYRYRVRFAGDTQYAASRSGWTQTSVRPIVGTPSANATIKRKASFTSKVTLRPRHTAGTAPVRLYVYRYSGGAWRLVGRYSAKASNITNGSMCAARLSFKTAGRYRMRAYHSDSDHSATWGAWRYFRVK